MIVGLFLLVIIIKKNTHEPNKKNDKYKGRN